MSRGITTTDRRPAWRLRALYATGRIPDGNVIAWYLCTRETPSYDRNCPWCGVKHFRRVPACHTCEET